MFTEDLNQFFSTRDFAVTANWTPANGDPPLSASVLLDAPGELVLGDTVISADYSISYATGQLAGLDIGETISVDGTDYRVRSVMPRPATDGAETVALLTRI